MPCHKSESFATFFFWIEHVRQITQLTQRQKICSIYQEIKREKSEERGMYFIELEQNGQIWITNEEVYA